MDPAKTILDRIGYEKAAEVTGNHISRVYRWTYPAGTREGTGGIIPHGAAIKLLAYARAQNLDIHEADFMKAPTVVREPQQQGAA